MRITELDLQCEDILWFTVDSADHIIALTSAGYSNVPEYICKDKETNEHLTDFFLQSELGTTHAYLQVKYSDSSLVQDAILLSSKGIFCYDSNLDSELHNYHCISIPEKPLLVSELPPEIQDILADHRYSGDASQNAFIAVEHAY